MHRDFTCSHIVAVRFVSFCSCVSSPDYILVRDGHEPHSRVIERLCNTRSAVDIVSSAENLSVELVSDEKKQQQGFAATFSFVSAVDRLPLQPPSDGLTRNTPPRAPWDFDGKDAAS